MLRISKILCIAAVAFYCFLDVFGNITDYYANFPAVQSTLMMKDIFPNSTIGYRAISNPVIHHLGFAGIIFFEALSFVLCALGALKLFRVRNAAAQVFNQSKNWAIAGLTCGFLTWQVLFMSIAGEWFGIWMSSSLSGAISTAFRVFMMMLGVLIYLVMKDE